LRSKTFTIAFTAIFLTLVTVGCFGLVLSGYSTYTNYVNPYTYVPTRPASSLIATPGTTATRAIIFVLDGVRADIFYKTPKPNIDSFSWANWTNIQCNTLTSVSKTGYSTIASGVNSSESQVISNDYPDTELFKGDSLFNDTIRHNGNTSVVGYYWWWEFFKPWLNWSVTYDSTYIGVPTTSMNSTNGGTLVNTTYPAFLDSLVAQDATEIVQKNKPTFMVVHFSLADEYAHHEGGSIGTYYANAIKNEDTYIGQILGAYSSLGILTSTLVIVTADHGHVDIGGHGGPEPEVLHVPLLMMGPGVVNGSYDTPQHQNSIAPTVAALMGWEIPSDASGTVLFPCLTLTQMQQAIYRIDIASIRLAQATITLQKMGYLASQQDKINQATSSLTMASDNFTAANYALAISNSITSLNVSTDELRYAITTESSSEITNRVVLGAVIIAVIVLLVAVLLYRKRSKVKGIVVGEKQFLPDLVLSTILYFVLLIVATALSGFRFSASYFPEAGAGAFIMGVGMTTLLAFVPAGIVFLVILMYFNGKTKKTDARAITWAAIFLLILAIIYNSAMVYFVIKNGSGLPWYAHDLNEPIGYFYIGISAAMYALFALVSFLGGLGVAKVLGRGSKSSK
jgi:hypothetical protein